jgi:hypothetical protein
MRSGPALAALAALAIVLAAAYEKKWLNKWLPAKWQKEGFGSPCAQCRMPTRMGDIAASAV